MSNVKKLLMAAAGGAGGAGLDVDEVFSTYLYTGDNNTRTITNNIDFSGEGGLLWIQNRSQGGNHHLFDTERGSTKNLHSNRTDGDATSTTILTSFNSNGYSIGTGGNSTINNAGDDFVAWSWRKAPKFFDVVTFTGTGSAQTISHNLGSVPGMIMVKRTNSSAEWRVYHTSLGYTKYLALHNTDAATTDASNWQATPTSSVFSVGSDSEINGSGSSYVAYLFAHNDGDGEFGPDSDQDIIKCGSYTGNGSSTGPTVDLGFEPQWILIKNTTTAGQGWYLWDTMRGIVTSGSEPILQPHLNDAESSVGWLDLTSTGFAITDNGYQTNKSGDTYIYMAIRRGPLAEPTSASDVFSIDTSSGTSPTPPAYVANHLVDFAFFKDTNTTGNWQSSSRFTQGRTIQLNTISAEASSSVYKFDFMNGWVNNTFSNSNRYAWMWKRAPSYFDVVAYTGTGSATTINHNLGAIPEMIWLKRRDAANFEWIVYHKGLNGGTSPEDYVLYLNATNAEADVAYWDDTAPTSTTFRVSGFGQTGANGGTYIAYLFTSLAGISKCGSYTGNGSTTGDSQNIDCGFSSGAKFVLIKPSSDSGDWSVYDSTRGIVAGNDARLALDRTDAQETGDDRIDPFSSGFTAVHKATGRKDCNSNGVTYVFYAIAA